MLSARNLQKAFEHLMTTQQDQDTVNTVMRSKLENKNLSFHIVAPDPDFFCPVLVDNGDGDYTGLVAIRINITVNED
ncbi:MAG: hypothetical protein SGI77_01315 [Pirellulaceae bacterium]|nr:hypothetical protein [Pirellulaceae bacterium]